MQTAFVSSAVREAFVSVVGNLYCFVKYGEQVDADENVSGVLLSKLAQTGLLA